MVTPRKTNKYYREELAKSHNTLTMENLIKEIIGKYGNDDEISPERAEFNWNHCVTAFRISGLNKRLLVRVYWQGDSTDGDDYVYFDDLYRNGKSTIKSTDQHGTLYVEKEELTELISNLAKWLMPNEIKARKIRAEISKIESMVSRKLGNEYYRNYYNKYNSNGEPYYNGCGAVRKMLEEQGEKLLKMSEEEILKAVEKVFKVNFKSDYHFGKKDMWGQKTNPFDTTI